MFIYRCNLGHHTLTLWKSLNALNMLKHNFSLLFLVKKRKKLIFYFKILNFQEYSLRKNRLLL